MPGPLIVAKALETTVKTTEKLLEAPKIAVKEAVEDNIILQIDLETIETQSLESIIQRNLEMANTTEAPLQEVGLSDAKYETESTLEDYSFTEYLDNITNSYYEDLLNNSEYPETLESINIKARNFEKLSPEETALKREEFDNLKADLKKQWELEYGSPWPKYETDVYSSNGKLIRQAGTDYDAHHIQPLSLGGKNEVSNITPLHAEVHYDKQGIHSPDSPYYQLSKILEGS